MVIRYAESGVAWSGWAAYVENLIERKEVQKVLEVGGGANPTFSTDFVDVHRLQYSVLDISQEELSKAPDGYIKIQGDITDINLDLPGEYDLVFSKMLAEHVRSGERFHQNIYRLLSKGGTALHFFPTLYAPPFLMNRILPESLAESLLRLLQPGRERQGKNSKFPAYYSWCRGPTDSQFKRFESLGYVIEEYVGFFGHDTYYMKLPILRGGHRALSTWLVQHPIPWLTSFAQVSLVKN